MNRPLFVEYILFISAKCEMSSSLLYYYPTAIVSVLYLRAWWTYVSFLGCTRSTTSAAFLCRDVIVVISGYLCLHSRLIHEITCTWCRVSQNPWQINRVESTFNTNNLFCFVLFFLCVWIKSSSVLYTCNGAILNSLVGYKDFLSNVEIFYWILNFFHICN